MFLKNKVSVFLSTFFALNSFYMCIIKATDRPISLVPMKQDIYTTTEAGATKITKNQYFSGKDITFSLKADDKLNYGDVWFFSRYVVCFLAGEYEKIYRKPFPQYVPSNIKKLNDKWMVTLRVPVDEVDSENLNKYIEDIPKNAVKYCKKLDEYIENEYIKPVQLFENIEKFLNTQKTSLNEENVDLVHNSQLTKINSNIDDIFSEINSLFCLEPLFDFGLNVLDKLNEDFQISPIFKNESISKTEMNRINIQLQEQDRKSVV